MSEAIKKERNNPFYKSSMCKNKTDCAYGEHCVYAHNESELRQLPPKVSQINAIPSIFAILSVGFLLIESNKGLVFNVYYNGLTARIFINGNLSNIIKILRGLKQGDALSCAIFIICVDP